MTASVTDRPLTDRTRDVLRRAGNPFRNYFARNPDDEVCARFHVPELFAAERDLLHAIIDLYRYDPQTHSEVVPVLGNKGAGKTHLLYSIKHGGEGAWQMLVTPGTHHREVWNHHGDDGCFAGLIDPDLIKDEIKRAVPCIGSAGTMSFHHVRALHGSAMNTSNRPRNLLLYEVAASDAWPLMGVKDFDEFNSRLLSGETVIAPRMTNVPVRLPLPPAKRQGSIYETQSAAKKSYFTRAA